MAVHQPLLVYLVFSPEEILDRRRAVGLPAYPKGLENEHGPTTLDGRQRVIDVESLKPREAKWRCAVRRD